MNFKCNKCQQIFEVASESSVRFCPNCGAKNDFEETLLSKNSIQSNKCICPVCSTAILSTDESIVCPDCKIAYHKDCWKENNGCATYGCKSAGSQNNPPPPITDDVPGGWTTPPDPTQNTQSSSHPSFECPHCHTQLTVGTNICWSCGKDISDIGRFAETNGFDFSKLTKLANALKIVGVLSLLLNYIGRMMFSMGEIDNEMINNPICKIITYAAYIAPFITNIIWLVLWKAMKKSIASIVTLAIILFGLLFARLILGYLFLFATTSQVDTIIKNKGRVQVTFWGVKPVI